MIGSGEGGVKGVVHWTLTHSRCKSVNSFLAICFLCLFFGLLCEEKSLEQRILGVKNVKALALENVSTDTILMTNSCRGY